ncbi:hypothetical protein FEE95_18075 [Maribacter algarum]|uniref:Lipoprotein n=1 Tax=Maribacter algarum (ex Zhang et al. 2020) TaxID=2578118 RepID=A0A5S3PN01_9FLAO|nr:hypothetical protein [Maribacter algarum]TMM53806.1 hypothetical protein FEE95_18075 [Maribacter algarum]
MKNYLVAVLFVLASCNGQKKASMKDSSSGSKPANSKMVLLVQDEYGGFDVEETMIIKDEKRLKSLYAKINRTRKPGLPLPIIDFSKEMVIFHCVGEQNFDGLPVLTFNAETEKQVILNSDMHRDSKENLTSIRTNLFCIYKIPITKKEVLVERNFK